MAGRVRIAAYGLARQGGKVLLTRIAPGYPAEGQWTLPGGGMEFGESPVECLEREFFEETGLRCVPGEIIGINSIVFDASEKWPDGAQGIRIVYRVNAVGEPSAETDGSTDLAEWIDLADLPGLPAVDLVDWAVFESS